MTLVPFTQDVGSVHTVGGCRSSLPSSERPLDMQTELWIGVRGLSPHPVALPALRPREPLTALLR